MIDKILIDRSVVEQALDAFDVCKTEPTGYTPHRRLRNAAITALRAALEQPQVEQEPIAYEVVSKTGDYCLFRSTAVKKGDKVYAQPQPRQPLTPEAVNDLWIKHARSGAYIHAFARAIERAHGIGGEK